MALKINSTRLMELLKDFYLLSGVRIVIFDDECREILSYPQQPMEYCALLMGDAIAKKQCDRCDLTAFEKCRVTGNLQIYKCHAGLIEAVAPIKDNNETLGYVMFGHVLDSQDKEAAFKEVRQRLSHYETDIGTLEKEFYKLRYRSHQQIKAAASIMEACACYLWLSELISVKAERLVSKIDKYILSHIEEQFTVQQLCCELQISRSTLYKFSMRYYGMGIAEYIKKQRLQEAMRRLLKTDDAVSLIAEQVGISDYNYFYKIFKRETGLSPRRFRIANQESE
ncbi:MAG: PocR ligand-binding domain-containing protein [Clostridia bacterium]|nr:PocR ligand-binding domain-containing protein [Clostridia bacterium]